MNSDIFNSVFHDKSDDDHLRGLPKSKGFSDRLGRDG